MELKTLAQQYFTENKHLQLATISDGNPWICTVYFVADENFNLYWTSGRSRQLIRNSKQSKSGGNNSA